MNIYVDVLFVVNFFITYLLLLFTAFLSKIKGKTYRLVLSSLIGGVYSLSIFLDERFIFLSALAKLLISFIIIIVAFGFVRCTVFFRRLVIFYFSNLLFLGIIVGFDFLFKTDAFRVNNSIVYFNISAPVLLISALFAYLISVGVIHLHNRILSRKEIYFVKLYKEDREYSLYAFLDSGNRLHEPFSNYPVVIADKNKVNEKCDRVIPYNTVGGDGMLKAFRPDRLDISVNGKTLSCDKVYVALSDISSKDFSLILSQELLKGE